MDVNFDGDGNLDVAADALKLKTFWSIAEVVALAGCQRSAAKSPLPSPSKFTLPTTTMTKSTVRDRSRTYDQSSAVNVDGDDPCLRRSSPSPSTTTYFRSPTDFCFFPPEVICPRNE